MSELWFLHLTFHDAKNPTKSEKCQICVNYFWNIHPWVWTEKCGGGIKNRIHQQLFLYLKKKNYLKFCKTLKLKRTSIDIQQLAIVKVLNLPPSTKICSLYSIDRSWSRSIEHTLETEGNETRDAVVAVKMWSIYKSQVHSHIFRH